MCLTLPDERELVFQRRLFREARRILVTGSRTFVRRHLPLARAELVVMSEDTVIVHGGQGRRDWRGVILSGCDLLVGELAREMGFVVEEHPVSEAEWRMLGGAAGPRRNLKMLRTGIDLVLAFWDGVSPGTRGCMEKARELGIPLRVIEID